MKKLSRNIFHSFRLDYKYTPTSFFGILLLMGITFNSCKPDPPDPGPKDLGFFGLDEAKDYVYFKPGTWWVYQNTISGLRDSIIVFNCLIDTIEQISKKWHFSEELFIMDSKSFLTGHYYYHYSRPQGTEGMMEPIKAYISNLERREPFEGDIIPFYYPFDLHGANPSSGYTSHCLTVKDTMIINNKIFHAVAIFYIKSDGTEPLPLKHNAAKYYWAKNYGLVQKDLFDSKFLGDTSVLYHSWKLINSNIVQ